MNNSNSAYQKKKRRFKNSNKILAQKQPKKLLRLLTNPAYNSKLQTGNNSNNKTYVNECSFLTLFNGIN